MGVVTPERERVEPPRQPTPPPPPPPRRDIPWGLIVVGIVVALLATGVISFRDLLPSFDNPFRAIDSASASSRGRLTLAPSNSYHGVNGLASVKLPHRSRASAFARTT